MYEYVPDGKRKRKTLNKAMEKVLVEETIVYQRQTKMYQGLRDVV